MLGQRLQSWSNISPTLAQHFLFVTKNNVGWSPLPPYCIIAPCVLEGVPIVGVIATSTQCWPNVGPLSATLAPHWTINGWKPSVYQVVLVTPPPSPLTVPVLGRVINFCPQQRPCSRLKRERGKSCCLLCSPGVTMAAECGNLTTDTAANYHLIESLIIHPKCSIIRPRCGLVSINHELLWACWLLACWLFFVRWT